MVQLIHSITHRACRITARKWALTRRVNGGVKVSQGRGPMKLPWIKRPKHLLIPAGKYSPKNSESSKPESLPKRGIKSESRHPFAKSFLSTLKLREGRSLRVSIPTNVSRPL